MDSRAILVLAWGNRSRGDDALGPMLLQNLRDILSPHALAHIDLLEDYQLQIEHTLDLLGRQQVLFVDASVACTAPFAVTPVDALPEASLTTHALSPQALLSVFAQTQRTAAPPCTQLAIRGESFELGAPPSAAALAYLQAATRWAVQYLVDGIAQCR